MVVIIARRRQLLNSGRTPFLSMAFLDPSRQQIDLANLGNSLLAHNVYDLRFHDCSPRRLDQILRRRLVDIILD